MVRGRDDYSSPEEEFRQFRKANLQTQEQEDGEECELKTVRKSFLFSCTPKKKRREPTEIMQCPAWMNPVTQSEMKTMMIRRRGKTRSKSGIIDFKQGRA